MALAGVAAMALTLCLASTAMAQSTTYRLEIRKTAVVEENYTIFFSLLGSQQQAIKKVNKADIKLLSGDKQDEIPVGDLDIKLLADTPRTVAVMFVVANTRAFNEKNSSSRAASQEFISKMRQIDVAGFIHYGTRYRDLEFTQDTKALSSQIDLIKDSDDGEPRIFAALSQAVRLFNKDLDQQAIDLRYLIVISDGAGDWSGLADQTLVDKKISNFSTRLKELKVMPIIVGYAPLLGPDEEGLTMMRQLASRSGGTYREATDKEGVFGGVDAAYNEIYGAHVMTFTTSAFEQGQNHKIRLAATVDSLKLKSPPETVYVPESGSNIGLYLGIGGGLCLLLAFIAAIGAGIAFIVKKRREKQDQGDVDEYAKPVAAGAAVGGMAVAGAIAPAMAQKYDDTPPAQFHGKLKARTGPLHGRTFYIVEETTTLGSADSNTIVLQDGTVSKKHAGVRVREGNRFELHDFGSTNGLFINGRRISKQFLKDGDVIKIGDTELIFSVE